MNNRISKRETFVLLGCVLFLLFNLAAIGQTGREHARRILCLANMKGIVAGVTAYATNDLQGRLPAIWQGDLNNPAASSFCYPYFVNGGMGEHPAGTEYKRLVKAVKDERLLVCPSQSSYFGASVDAVTQKPADGRPFRFQMNFSYYRLGVNYLAGFPSEIWDEPADDCAIWISPKKLTDDGSLPVVADFTYDTTNGIWASHGPKGYFQKLAPRTSNMQFKTDLKGGGGNIGYLDGSAKWKDIEECEKYEETHFGSTWSNTSTHCWW